MIKYDPKPRSIYTIITAIEDQFPNLDKKDEVYVGITNNPDKRLSDHKVDNDDKCIILKANSRETAKEIEKYILDNHPNALGDTGGGTDDTVFIYAFEWDFDKHES